MARLALSSVFSRAFGGLFHGVPNRRARRALGWKASSTRPAGSSRRRVRPGLEMLEDRITPNSTFTPTTFADDPSKGFTLRQAVSAFNADNSDPGGGTTDIIQLAAGTYTLSIPNASGNKHEQGNASGDLNINNTNFINPILTIQGAPLDANGNPTTIIQQTQADRVFQILNQGGGSEGPETVIFKNLIIEGGDALENGGNGVAADSTDALGGGILDNGGEAHVTLSNVVLKSNKAVAGSGLNAYGGGIFVAGDNQGRGLLSIQNSVVQNDSALGGAVAGVSANGRPEGFAAGGGVAASGGGVINTTSIGCNVSISNSALGDNSATGGNAAGGNLNGAGGGGAAGGGVYYSAPNSLAALTLSNCNLSDNHVTGGNASDLAGGGGEAQGGSIYANGHSITVNGLTALGNTVTGGSASAGAGGSALGGGGYVQGPATLQSSDLSNNTVTGGAGTISGTTLPPSIGPSTSIPGDVGGRAEGGGIWTSGANSITGSNLSGNTLTGGNGTVSNSSVNRSGDVGGQALGGGAAVFGDLPLTITESILSGNNVNGGNGTYSAGTFTGTVGGAASGGGVYLSTPVTPTPTLTIDDSTLAGNSVNGGSGKGGSATPGFASGGGISEGGAGKETITLINSTIAANVAFGNAATSTALVASGGGLFFGSTTTATLTNVTVVGNQVEAVIGPNGQGTTSGGGIANSGGTVTLVNTLMASNGADSGDDFAGTVTNSSHNLLDFAGGSSGFSAAHGDLLGTETAPINPNLGSLTNNGGPLIPSPTAQVTLPTIALLANSPAINAGDNNAQSVTGPNDQRGQGFARVVNGTIDIGAFEVQPPKVTPPLVIKPPPSPATPPTLHTPSLLSFFDSLLAGVEAMNSDGSVTVTDSIFGIPLLVATYDSSGNLLSVTLFGINVTSLFKA
jgi:hypothetical protein